MSGRFIRGMVAVKEGDDWREYVLWNVSFDDTMFISRSQILTAGSTTPNQMAETEKREAVISYSSDGGENWSFIYHNAKVGRISDLAAIKPDHVWAVGDEGLILRLTFQAR